MKNKSTGAIICPNCRKLINADDRICMYCGTVRPGSIFKNNIWTKGLTDPDQFYKWIIYVNVAMYMITILFNPKTTGFSINPLTFLAPDTRSLLLLGATGVFPIEALNRWWTLLSANYLHGGILHIFFNMMALRQLAPFIGKEFGTYKLIIIYTIGGVLGFFVSYIAGKELTIGASSALCALIGATLFYGKHRGGAYGQAVFRQVGGWVVFLFAFGLIVPNIDNWAHGGGIVAGILLGFILGYREIRKESIYHKIIAGICALSTLTVLIWAVGYAMYIRIAG